MRRSLALISAAAVASLWAGCPGAGSADAGACGTATDACTTSLQCCTGFECQLGHCAFVGGGNNGNNGNGGGTSGGAGTTTTHGSSSSGGLIGGSNGFGGTSGGGIAGSSGGGIAGSSSGGSSTGAVTTTTTYCDGLQVSASGENTLLVETYVFEGQLTTDGCAPTLTADLDGADLEEVGGIYDVDANDNGAATPADAIFPAGCDDLGLSTFVPPSGTPFSTPPAGASTVAAAYAPATPAAVSIYGVVTAIKPWVSTPTAKSGQMYLQDIANGTPAPKSGALVYFAAAGVASYGAAPARGDVVEVTNVTWSPYKGQNQFAAAATSVVTNLGTSSLPAPVSMISADVGPTATTNGQQYWGMRVSVDDSPFVVTGSQASNSCPASLEDTITTP